MKISHRLLIITLLSIIAFGLVYPFAPIAAAPKAGLCILIVIAGLWMSEALPVAITALLIPILAALFHLETLTGSLAHFASPVVFLIFGGFISFGNVNRKFGAFCFSGSIFNFWWFYFISCFAKA